MADLDLTLSMADYDRTRALIDRSVKPEGINLTYVVSAPSETFWRMLRFNEFDMSEMSISSLLIAKAQGRPWTAIPVFPFRAFFHTLVFISPHTNIKEPGDLKGKRFGLPEYQMTAAVWVRGTLQHEFDVPPSAIRWYVERRAALSHGGATGFQPPPGVSIEQVPEEETLGSLLAAGKLDALMPSPYPGMTSRLNRTDYLALQRSSPAKLLFQDPLQEGARYFRRNGFSHINHTTIIQERILEKHPWVAMSVFRAFDAAKQKCYQQIDYLLRSSLVFAYAYLEEERRVFGKDPYPYGLQANKKALETLADYSYEQGLTNARVPIEQLFAASTRGL